jgi:hypothetical protein
MLLLILLTCFGCISQCACKSTIFSRRTNILNIIALVRFSPRTRIHNSSPRHHIRAANESENVSRSAATACISSWDSWLSSSLANDQEFQKLPKVTMSDEIISERFSEAAVVGISSTYTACDGIPRIKFTSTGISWSTSGYEWTMVSVLDKGFKRFSDPVPNCTVPFNECAEKWRYYQKWWNFSFPDSLNTTERAKYDWAKKVMDQGFRLQTLDEGGFFMCPKPNTKEFCGGCNVAVGRFALIYFAPDIVSRDICGNDGAGEYVTRTRNSTGVVTTVLDEIPIQSFNPRLGMLVAGVNLKYPLTLASRKNTRSHTHRTLHLHISYCVSSI